MLLLALTIWMSTGFSQLVVTAVSSLANGDWRCGMKAVTRRNFLGMSAAGVAATTMAAPLVRAPRAQAASAQALAGDVGAGSTAPVRPFPLSVVRLGNG